MKKTLIIAIQIIVAIKLYAQAPFPYFDSIDINNINAAILLHGDMWWNPANGTSKCEFPKGSGKNISFASALWTAGYDESGVLHVSAQTYRQDGNDYWPGPMYPSDTLTYSTSNDWAVTWKVKRTDLQFFLSLPVHTDSNTPTSILTWPGKGNIYATGSGGVPLSVATDEAPFADLNGNGLYEPLLGEYPDFPGEEAVWWVFSDNGPTHNQSNGMPVGIEVQTLAYAYKRNTLIDNVIYYKYKIINRSAHVYNNFRVSQWTDMRLGFQNNNYIGFDSSHRMGISYKAEPDDGASVGNPRGSYGTHIPMCGISWVSLPGDSAGYYVPAGCFDYYNLDASVIGAPDADTNIFQYMHCEHPDGHYFSNDFHGSGNPSSGSGSGDSAIYVFPGNPGDTSQWSECSSQNLAGNRLTLITSNDIKLPAGGECNLVLALITTYPDSNNSCPSGSFDSIKIYADTAWAIYKNPPPSYQSYVRDVLIDKQVQIFPNPAHNNLYIDNVGNDADELKIGVYNVLGQIQPVTIAKDNNKLALDISLLRQDIYYLNFYLHGKYMHFKFVKYLNPDAK